MTEIFMLKNLFFSFTIQTDRHNNRNNSFGSKFEVENPHLPFFKTKNKKVKVIFSSKGRHKLNVTPLIATFQKCIVLQHQKDFEKSTKAIHRLFVEDVPSCLTKPRPLKGLKKKW